MATFNYTPSFQATESSKPRAQKFQAGDGYEQRVRFGLNTDPKEWILTFQARDNTETTGIRDFLEARGGVESFNWTPPLWNATAGKYVCEEWQITADSYNNNTVSATFREVFEP